MRIANPKFYKTTWGEEASCPHCGSDLTWVECENCDEYGYSHHDCGEDTCCCLDQSNNVVCDWCEGKHGWYVCNQCDKKPQTVCVEGSKESKL